MENEYSYKERKYIRSKILKLVKSVSDFDFNNNSNNFDSFVRDRFLERVEDLETELSKLSEVEANKIFNSDLRRVNRIFRNLESFPYGIKVPDNQPLFKN